MLGVYLQNGEVSVRRMHRPERREGSAVIRLIYGGICNTDLELQRGYYGFRGVPGHEFVGEVVDADDPAWIGRRVVGEINLACGACEWCDRGLGRHCPHRAVLGILNHPGAFRELFTLPQRNLHVVSPNIPSEHAVFVEPLAAACEILDQTAIPRGANVAVLGDGKLGLLIAQVLHLHGAAVHHFGHHHDKLAISRRAGIHTALAQRLPAAAFDYVVDATGSAEALSHAVRLTRPRGTLILKSTVHGTVPLDTAPVIVNEIALLGSRCGRFEPALELLSSGKIQVAPLIAAIMPLDSAPRAFEVAAARGVLKVLLRP